MKSRNGPNAGLAYAAPKGSNALLPGKYQELLRKHLEPLLEELFAEFTGLHFQIAWLPAWRKGWDARTAPSVCSVCCKRSGSPQAPECRSCRPRHLAATLGAEVGHRFTCGRGVRNYWLRIRVRNETVSIAYLQALEHRTGPGAQHRRAGAVVLNGAKFARAARLLRFMVEYVETATLSDLRQADLSSAGRAVVALDRERARLHAALGRHLPAASEAPRSSGPESRAEQIARGLLERIELDYAKPLTLQRFARELGMNGAYLSSLFSRAVGTPFKRYLTEVRLQRARELLSDAAQTTAKVSFAVGYSSEERFRRAFKKATGLSPKVWRETMQTIEPERGA